MARCFGGDARFAIKAERFRRFGRVRRRSGRRLRRGRQIRLCHCVAQCRFGDGLIGRFALFVQFRDAFQRFRRFFHVFARFDDIVNGISYA